MPGFSSLTYVRSTRTPPCFFQAEDGIRYCLSDWSSDVCSSDLMLLTKIAVEPEVGLILIVRFGGGADKVVRPCHIGKRIVLENFCADRIESLRWYRIVLELGEIGRASCRERV